MRKLNNFSGVMAFLAGINLACLFRLQFSFMAIGNTTASKLKNLQRLMDPKKSWKNYRTALKGAVFPVVPYLFVFHFYFFGFFFSYKPFYVYKEDCIYLI